MTDAKLVVDVRVRRGEVGDRVLAEKQAFKHRLLDNAPDLLIVRPKRIETGLRHCGGDEIAVDGVEVDCVPSRVSLAAKWHQHKAQGARH